MLSGPTQSSRDQLERDVPDVAEVWNQLHAALAQRSVAPAVVHGDVCPPNAYLSQGPQGPVVTGIADFSPHTVHADPLMDVAGALIFLELEPYADAAADAAWLEAVAVERHGREIVRWIDVYRRFYGFYFSNAYAFDPTLYAWCPPAESLCRISMMVYRNQALPQRPDIARLASMSEETVRSKPVLGIDIGGSGIKGAPVDLATGEFTTKRLRITTPQKSTPKNVAAVVAEIVDKFADIIGDGPLGVTIPAVVTHGKTRSAANIDKSWIDADAEKIFEDRLGRDILLVNDADAAGIAEVHYGAAKGHPGLVIMTTLGTGIGSAIVYRGVLVPNSELGHLEIDGHDAETRAAASAREREGLSFSEYVPDSSAITSAGGPAVARPDRHRRWRQQELRQVHPQAQAQR